MTTRSVLISGAGIAGPALASWLTRAGVDVTVVERAPAPRPGGQAVDLRGAARTVAGRMGLLEEIRAVSVDQRGIAWVRDDGSVAARMAADAFGGEGIVSEIEVLRGDLADVLHRATAGTTEYVFGDSITGWMTTAAASRPHSNGRCRGASTSSSAPTGRTRRSVRSRSDRSRTASR